jgi:hypothetical protein
MTKQIEVWRMISSLRVSVEVFQFRAIILHKKLQEDPSTPLNKSEEEIEYQKREYVLHK